MPRSNLLQTWTRAGALAGAGILAFACGAPADADRSQPQVKTRVVDLGPMRIEGLYTSMAGPWAAAPFDFGDMDWVVGFRSEVMDATSGDKLPDEFFCHSQLQLDNDTPLIVTAMGVSSLRFPVGFGVPLKKIVDGMPEQWRGAHLFGMVLNNHDPNMKRDVKVRLTVEYQTSSGDPASGDLKKLYKQGLTMTRAPEEGTAALAGHPEGCALVGGREEHWYVPPGPQVTRRRLGQIVPMDATVHYALAHLHNYGKSMKLTDVTTGKVVWETAAVYEPGRLQIAEIPAYSSVTGFPVYAGHEYEIESLYDNTTDRPVDAMAMMYLFWHPPGNEDITYTDPPAGGAAGAGSSSN